MFGSEGLSCYGSRVFEREGVFGVISSRCIEVERGDDVSARVGSGFSHEAVGELDGRAFQHEFLEVGIGRARACHFKSLSGDLLGDRFDVFFFESSLATLLGDALARLGRVGDFARGGVAHGLAIEREDEVSA